MLKGYPGVARWEQTDDVLQNALVRLERALQAIRTPTSLDFFRLAASQIRRELIDMARHYRGPMGLGANHSSRGGGGGSSGSYVEPEAPADLSNDPGGLASWTEFHGKIESLPDVDREIFDLLWYQGLTQAEASVVLGVAERTVNRRWIAARLNLSDAFGGQLPI